MLIDLDLVANKWKACYPYELLQVLYKEPLTALQVLIKRDTPEWEKVPDSDRIWTVVRSEVLTLEQLVNFAQACVDRAKSHTTYAAAARSAAARSAARSAAAAAADAAARSAAAAAAAASAAASAAVYYDIAVVNARSAARYATDARSVATDARSVATDVARSVAADVARSANAARSARSARSAAARSAAAADAAAAGADYAGAGAGAGAVSSDIERRKQVEWLVNELS